uniref:hypothetical protein n=1 Tax=Chitinophaga sp. TaxID=1869181 RepID=UPI0031DFE803
NCFFIFFFALFIVLVCDFFARLSSTKNMVRNILLHWPTGQKLGTEKIGNINSRAFVRRSKETAHNVQQGSHKTKAPDNIPPVAGKFSACIRGPIIHNKLTPYQVTRKMLSVFYFPNHISMKQIILIYFILFTVTILKAQTHKVTIFSTVDPTGKIDYHSLKKILPDSIISKELKDPRKEFGIKDNYKVLLFMVESGWQLVNAELVPPTTILYYYMKKEIELDEAAYYAYMQKLKGN